MMPPPVRPLEDIIHISVHNHLGHGLAHVFALFDARHHNDALSQGPGPHRGIPPGISQRLYRPGPGHQRQPLFRHLYCLQGLPVGDIGDQHHVTSLAISVRPVFSFFQSMGGPSSSKVRPFQAIRMSPVMPARLRM